MTRALAAIARHAESDPGREVCGLVLREPSGAHVAVPVPNAADRWAAAEPARFPGGARRGYVLDPRALREALAAADARGAALVAVYHSHPGAPAVLSARDVAEAVADDGAPVLPGVDQLVVSLRDGKVVDARRYAWRGAAFEEVPLDPDAP